MGKGDKTFTTRQDFCLAATEKRRPKSKKSTAPAAGEEKPGTKIAKEG